MSKKKVHKAGVSLLPFPYSVVFGVRAWKSDKKAMYFLFVMKIRHKSVSLDNGKITLKEMPTSPVDEM